MPTRNSSMSTIVAFGICVAVSIVVLLLACMSRSNLSSLPSHMRQLYEIERIRTQWKARREQTKLRRLQDRLQTVIADADTDTVCDTDARPSVPNAAESEPHNQKSTSHMFAATVAEKHTDAQVLISIPSSIAIAKEIEYKTRTFQIVQSGKLHEFLEAYNDSLKAAAETDFHGPMQSMCAYALQGGKRVRAALVHVFAHAAATAATAASAFSASSLASNQTQGEPSDDSPRRRVTNDIAHVVEYIHAASLALDDMMDGDAERRGQPSVYSKFGLFEAQLVAVQLCAGALQRASALQLRTAEADAVRNSTLTHMVAETLQQLSLGQFIDIRNGDTEPSNSESADSHSSKHSETSAALKNVLFLKTGTLFQFSCAAGWIVGGGDMSTLQAVKAFGSSFGELFQIVDDIQDAQTDKERGKIAFNAVHQRGLCASMRDARDLMPSLRTQAVALGIRSSLFDELLTCLNAHISVKVV